MLGILPCIRGLSCDADALHLYVVASECQVQFSGLGRILTCDDKLDITLRVLIGFQSRYLMLSHYKLHTYHRDSGIALDNRGRRLGDDIIYREVRGSKDKEATGLTQVAQVDGLGVGGLVKVESWGRCRNGIGGLHFS